jgi:hypothetical protein
VFPPVVAFPPLLALLLRKLLIKLLRLLKSSLNSLMRLLRLREGELPEGELPEAPLELEVL